MRKQVIFEILSERQAIGQICLFSFACLFDGHTFHGQKLHKQDALEKSQLYYLAAVVHLNQLAYMPM